jgi:hypothetical protein
MPYASLFTLPSDPQAAAQLQAMAVSGEGAAGRRRCRTCNRARCPPFQPARHGFSL